MVWMVIAIPLSSVFVGSYMIYMAVTTFDGLVEDDYYKKGKEINQVLARDQFAVENGIKADIKIDDLTGVIEINLSSTSGYAFPDKMGMSLLHPTQSRRDVKLLITQGPDGRYFGELQNPLGKGRWYLRVSEANWRLQKLISMPSSEMFLLDGEG